MMNKSIVFVLAAAACILFPLEWASARGNHRNAIDRQWKQVQAWQAQQNNKFKAIEREAERSIRKIDAPEGSLSVPLNGYQRQCP
jgi:hypothetical protein